MKTMKTERRGRPVGWRKPGGRMVMYALRMPAALIKRCRRAARTLARRGVTNGVGETLRHLLQLGLVKIERAP